MFKAVPKVIREEVLRRVKEDGVTVPKAATDAGIASGTVYAWLSKESKTTNCDLIALNKLRRENEGLYEIIGKLTVAVEKSKKGRS